MRRAINSSEATDSHFASLQDDPDWATLSDKTRLRRAHTYAQKYFTKVVPMEKLNQDAGFSNRGHRTQFPPRIAKDDLYLDEESGALSSESAGTCATLVLKK